MFVNLFLLNVGADGLNHVAAGEDFVQHAFAEDFIPAAGAASGDTADNDRFFTAFAVGRSAHFARADRVFFHGAGGFFRRGGVAGYPVYKRGVKGGIVAIHIGSFPIQVDTGRNQVGEQVVKFHNTAFFGVVGSQHFDVFLVRKRVGSQRGKYAFGTAFHEQAHAGIVGGLELFNPFHGVGNLSDHQIFDFFRVARIEFRRHVSGDRHLGGVERKRIQERAILRHGRADDSGVESVGYGNLYRLDTHIGEHFDSVVNGFAGAGDNGLRRAVFVGHGHITANARKFRFHPFHGGRDGSHLTVVFHFNFGHYFPAGANGFQTVFKIKNTGSHGSGVFAQAVAHDHVRLNAEGGQQAHHGDVGRQHGGLGHFGFLNSGFARGDLFFRFAGFAPQRIGQVLADDTHQQAVGFVKRILYYFIFGSQVFHHVHILGTLPGEHEAHFGFNFGRRKRINAFHAQVEGFLFPNVLGRGGFFEESDFFFEFFRRFYVDRHREFGRFFHVVFVGNARQIGGIALNGDKRLIQHVKQFLFGRGGESQHIALDFLPGNVKGVRITAGHSRFLLYGRRNGHLLFGFFGLFKKAVVHFFHRHVEVRAAKAKGRNVGAADFVTRPFFRFGNHAEGAGAPVHNRVGGFKVYGRRQHLII